VAAQDQQITSADGIDVFAGWWERVGQFDPELDKTRVSRHSRAPNPVVLVAMGSTCGRW
jgi:hypothetical protein